MKHKRTDRNAFRKAREAARLRQVDVYSLTGISPATVSQLETGLNTNPTWDILGKLCQVYHCRPEELLGWPPLPNARRHRRAALPAEAMGVPA